MRRLALGLVVVLLPSVARAGLPSSIVKSAPTLDADARTGAPVVIPRLASEPVRVAAGDDSVSASPRLRGARAVDGVQGCGDTRYEAALSSSAVQADLVVRPIDGGVESLVNYRSRPTVEALTFDVTLRGAAGLRLVEDVLELVDAQGAPQLRLRVPAAVDARGERHDATIEVNGCAYDASPIAPWGRPVVAPGASSCEIVVRWGAEHGAELDYPVTVDTAWVDGGTLVFPRGAHAAAVLPDGRALLAGGYGLGATSRYARAAELFDPATGTWAVTASMRHARAHHGAALLRDGRAIFVGGDDGLERSAEVYDSARAMWTDTTPMNAARDGGRVALLPDGRVLAAGGCSAYDQGCSRVEATAEVFDADANTWTPSTNTMSTARAAFTLTTLPDGTVLAAGGCSAYDEGPDCARDTASADVFDPETNGWHATSSMPVATHDHVAAVLASGEVLIAGGTAHDAPSHASQTYDAKREAWTAAGELATGHARATASVLHDGRVLVAGSLGTWTSPSDATAGSELFEPRSRRWIVGPTMAHGHGEHTASALSDGSVLIAGGYENGSWPGARVSGAGEVYAAGGARPTAEAEGLESADAAELDADDLDSTASAMLQGCDIAGSPRRGTAAVVLAALTLALHARRRSALPPGPLGSRGRLVVRRST
jgi:hypothetical protein